MLCLTADWTTYKQKHQLQHSNKYEKCIGNKYE